MLTVSRAAVMKVRGFMKVSVEWPVSPMEWKTGWHATPPGMFRSLLL
jgi:hypothetical protein